MQNPRPFRRFFNSTSVAFLTGIIISVSIDILRSNLDSNNFRQGVISVYTLVLSILLLSVLGLLAVIAIETLRHNIDSKLDSIGLSSLWMAEQTESNEGFARTRDIVLGAKTSIIVLSHYIPPTINMDFTDSRKSYLANGIETVIRERLSRPELPPLTYRRILQSELASEMNGTMRRNTISGDQQTFEHCKRVFELLENTTHSNVHVDFRVSKPIPSFPSTLIVDNRYILFALSTRASRISASNGVFRVVGVLLIEDRDGTAVRGFKNMFDRFYENSYSISRIDPSVQI